LGDGFYKFSAVAEMDDRLVTIHMGCKEGEGYCEPFEGGEAGSPSKHITMC